jgi:hypothetical protein
MNFNVDRIAVLAGLAQSGKSGLIREGAAPVTPAPGAKPAAPTPPASKAPPPAPAKAAPAPTLGKKMEEEDYEEGYGMHEEMEDEANEMYHDTMGGMGYDEDVVYEVDETQLMEALVDMREKRLNESRVRSAVREELTSILNSRESGSRWLYGDRQPSNSGKGKVARGFLGPGFR